ncbi:MAG TPA: sialidase family protein, partial [Caldilineaceae bacterium]|nr:sialidase family protein [Caldilineaceae bacterium]
MGDGSKGNRWINPKCAPLAVTQRGPFVQFPDGRLMTVGKNVTMVSHDGGLTWPDVRPIYQDGPETVSTGPGIPSGRGQLLLTRNGTLLLVWMDERTLNWDETIGEPGPDARGDQWAIRSIDGGQTWTDRQRLYQGVCGHPPLNMTQTASGRIVVTAQFYLREPGRN